MNLSNTFLAARTAHKKLFIPFLVGGDPNLESTLDDAMALAKMGADILEIGVPFSDPVADGPVVQQASERALLNHTTLLDCCLLVKKLREQQCQIPIVLYTYFNPILQLGMEEFVLTLVAAKIEAVLVVDLPLEETAQLASLLQQHNIGLVLLITPTTTKERIQISNKVATAFLYYVARTGVTGATTVITPALSQNLLALQQEVNLPVVVGFGFKQTTQIAALKTMAIEGVVVGSALIEMRALQGQQAMLENAASFIKILHAAG